LTPSIAKQPVGPSSAAALRPRFRSGRTVNFTESVIREMTRLAVLHDAVNLAQGFPDFGSPEAVKEAARTAISEEHNQYTITWGAKNFRQAIAAHYRNRHALDFDPEREVTVVCGSTEAMIASLLATTNAGEEVIVFEPYYENYGPDTWLCGAERKLVRLHPPDWTFDPEELRRAFSPRTKAIIVTNPHNPTGKVFSRGELGAIAELCNEFDTLAITDEIYEHILYDGAQHVPLMTMQGMRDRTILVNSLSKTFSVTGWRVGWILAAPDLSDSIRKVHDFLTVNAAAPMQQAGILALGLGESFHEDLRAKYKERRDLMLGILDRVGFRTFVPKGAYYIMAGISDFGFPDDHAFARHLLEVIGVAAVPGSSFFEDPADGHGLIRFCFCKKIETLEEAARRLSKMRTAPR
jgi:aminotransferase